MIESLIIMSICVYFEARGEPEAGQMAVAQVILNRAEEKGISVKEVIMEPHQFSWVNDGILDKIDDFDVFIKCAQSVWKAMQERLMGKNLNFANHYHNPHKCGPKWADKMIFVAEIGNHIFSRDRTWHKL